MSFSELHLVPLQCTQLLHILSQRDHAGKVTDNTIEVAMHELSKAGSNITKDRVRTYLNNWGHLVDTLVEGDEFYCSRDMSGSTTQQMDVVSSGPSLTPLNTAVSGGDIPVLGITQQPGLNDHSTPLPPANPIESDMNLDQQTLSIEVNEEGKSQAMVVDGAGVLVGHDGGSLGITSTQDGEGYPPSAPLPLADHIVSDMSVVQQTPSIEVNEEEKIQAMVGDGAGVLVGHDGGSLGITSADDGEGYPPTMAAIIAANKSVKIYEVVRGVYLCKGALDRTLTIQYAHEMRDTTLLGRRTTRRGRKPNLVTRSIEEVNKLAHAHDSGGGTLTTSKWMDTFQEPGQPEDENRKSHLVAEEDPWYDFMINLLNNILPGYIWGNRKIDALIYFLSQPKSDNSQSAFQAKHTDYRVSPGLERAKCIRTSGILALCDDTMLDLTGGVSLKFMAGDVVIFEQDVIHSGAGYKKNNYRMHWYCHSDGIQAGNHTHYARAQDTAEQGIETSAAARAFQTNNPHLSSYVIISD
jgi:hypothetical protein